MSRRFLLSVVLAVATAALVSAGLAGAAAAPRISKGDPDAVTAQWAPGTVLVKFRPSVTRAEARSSLAARGARSVQRINTFGIDVVKLPRGLSVSRAVALFKSDRRVETVEPDFYRYFDALPNDTFAQHLWPLENTGQDHFFSGGGTGNVVSGTADADMDVTEAWGTETGQATTIVAVVDSGVDVAHPDLDGSLWTNPLDPTDNNFDDDNNGKEDDTHGWNFAGPIAGEDDDLLPDPSLEGFDHGTHVAGIIAAERNNTTGVAGVCPGCRVMALRFMGEGGNMLLSDEIQAIAYAKTHGAQIINASFGGVNWSGLEREAIRTSGLLFVAAASNDSLDNDMKLFSGNTPVSPSYPAAYDLANILTVAATNDLDEYGYSTACVLDGNTRSTCAFTNWGRDSVDVAAPGVDVLSTVPVGTGDVGGDYEEFDGTSMATPNVAGVAGLVKSEHSTYTTAQLKNAIMRSVDHPAGLDLMPTIIFANRRQGIFTRTNDGRVNANTALSASTAALPKTDGNVGGAVAMLGTKNGAVAWPSDVNDVYKRKFTKNVRYRVRLDGPRGKDFDLYVYKPGTKEIWQPARLSGRSISLSADEAVTFRPGVTGTFFIQVSAWLANSGSYKLIITRL
jgi:subtilisin family serine protease